MLGMSGTQRWGGGTVGTAPNGNVSTTGWGVGAATSVKEGNQATEETQQIDFDKEGATVFEVGEEEDEDEDDGGEKRNRQEDVVVHDPWAQSEKGTSNGCEFYFFISFHATSTNAILKTVPPPLSLSRTSLSPTGTTTPNSAVISGISTPTINPASNPSGAVNSPELLLSLDVAVEVIHADREALKRAETFANYPGHYGHRVRDTIEEVFILMLSALREKHVSKGFAV